MTDTSKSKIHFCKPICCWFFFLSIYLNSSNITLFCFNKFSTLNKHTTRTTCRVKKCSVIRFNHCCYKLNYIMWSIKFSFFFCCVYSKLFKEVFVYMANEVFFFAKFFMADFIYFINNFLNIIWSEISSCKCTLYKTTF